ncbi:hypothetical protein BFJ68_g17176 [Fusarium oxysporum]|uniref:Uncharacterized protein n=1 Tax=Fusarium oxysporum TaxID=5507 RepID=A0A420P0J3_FUSOX|nr:hypothetical protein BFJ68_g17176 [Fusarium oxysporum]
MGWFILISTASYPESVCSAFWTFGAQHSIMIDEARVYRLLSAYDCCFKSGAAGRGIWSSVRRSLFVKRLRGIQACLT